MASTDRARRVAGLLAVGVGLAFQVVWLLLRSVPPGPATLVLCTAVALLAVAVVTGGERATRVLAWVVAGLLALDLAGAVADRFGAWGPPGAPGVWWGGWTAFVAYTGRLLPAGGRVVLAAAVLATAVEVVLCGLLLSGRLRRWAGAAVAGLLVVYLVTMVAGVGLGATAPFALPVLIGGALLVSSCPRGRELRYGRRPTSPVVARPAGVTR